MKKKVMIVEDEMIIAMSYREALNRADFDVLPMFDTGEEAVESVLSLNPDIVLMDIKLNGSIGGIEAARSIKEKLDIPVIYLSGNTGNNTREMAMATNPAAYLSKPVDLRDLIYKIKETLR
jgi:two-component system response regulator